MNRIRKKLQSNSGASVMIALGLFLICTMISSVVITAAAGGSSRSREERLEQQREYLSISSAAQTVMDEITKLKRYVGREIDSYHACNDYCNGEPVDITYDIKVGDAVNTETVRGWRLPFTNVNLGENTEVTDVLIPQGSTIHPDQTSDNRKRYPEGDETLSDEAIGTELKGALAGAVENAVKELYERNLEGTEWEYKEDFTIQLSTPQEVDKIKPVKCEFIMDSQYNITIKLTIAGSEEDRVDSDYAFTITAKAKKDVKNTRITDGSEPDGLICEHDIYYKYFKNGKFESTTGKVDIIGINDITTTTVTWNPPRLLKGIE